MYAKKMPISDLREGERVEDIFVVKIKKGMKPYAKGYAFSLLLSDASGRNINYRYWGDENQDAVKGLYESVKADSAVLVQGRVERFQESLQISTNPPDTIRALKDGEFRPGEFIGPARRDLGEMVTELKGYIGRVKNDGIRHLLERVFLDTAFIERFREHPGAIEIHHNWRGGLLEHTLEVMKYCDLSGRLFPELDTDILIAGALLHDIGKLDEIETTTRIKGTLKGQLRGHIALGYGYVSGHMDELKTPDGIREKILHIMLSHHGNMEYGSPKQPMFPEAMAIYFADELSSKLAEFIEFRKRFSGETEDDFMYSRRHGRNILLR
jgi:3'-5' exoribonuclease